MAFIASKTLGYLLLPGNLLFITLTVGLVLWLRGRRKWGLRLAVGATGLLVVLGVFPVGQWLLAPLESRFPPVRELPEHIDGIIVLGGALRARLSAQWQQPVLNEGAERMTATVALARRYPDAKVIFTGGRGSLSQKGPTEAEAAVVFFHRQGIAPERLMIEDESRNTYENALLTREFILPRDGQTWLLVTSAYHMPRSMGCFRKAGWNVLPYPVDFRHLDDQWPAWRLEMGQYIAETDFAARAWAGLVAYYLMGRTSALLPGPRHPSN